MSSTLTTPDNKTVEKPNSTHLADALHTVLTHADLDADLWVEHDSGWTLSVTHSGDLFLEDLTGDRKYWTLRTPPRSRNPAPPYRPHQRRYSHRAGAEVGTGRVRND